MEDIKARIVIKRGNGIATIPPSNDHRNGDWISTDIYEGEFYMDVDTGVIYTRLDTLIYIVSGNTMYTEYSVLLTQTSGAPADVVLTNTLSGTPTYTTSATGTFKLTLTGAFTANKTEIILNNGVKDGWIKAWRVNDNDIQITTRDDSFALSDGILSSTSLIIRVYE